MRREGNDLMVSQPQVIFKEGPNGEKIEPYEHVVIFCAALLRNVLPFPRVPLNRTNPQCSSQEDNLHPDP